MDKGHMLAIVHCRVLPPSCTCCVGRPVPYAQASAHALQDAVRRDMALYGWYLLPGCRIQLETLQWPCLGMCVALLLCKVALARLYIGTCRAACQMYVWIYNFWSPSRLLSSWRAIITEF